MYNLTQRRNGFEVLGNSYPVANNVKREDVKIAGVQCAWFWPVTAVENSIIVFIHGGGFFLGSLNSHAPMVSYIAQTLQRKVLAIDYRLAPEHPYPAGLMDCVSVIKTITNEYPAMHYGIMGDSAGGNLAFTVQLQLKDKGYNMPDFSIAISPVTDFETKHASYNYNKPLDTIISREYIIECIKMYAPGLNYASPYLSPLNGDFTGFPPVLLMCGTYEVLLDDSVELYKRLQQAGVEAELELFEDEQHVWLFTDIESEAAKKALNIIKAFVAKHGR